MAKAKTVSVPVLDSVTEGDDSELNSEEQDAIAALMDIEGGAEARWQIHRIAMIGIDKRPGFVSELTSGELRLSEIQKRFGAGKYRIKGLRSDGTYLKSITVEVADDPPTKSVIASGGNETRDVLTIMQEREDRRAERSRELMLAVVPGAITAVAGIFTAMMSRQQPQQNILSDLATLKTVLGPPPQVDSPMDSMIKLMELGRKFGGGGDKESTWLDVVKEAVATAGPMLMDKLGGAPLQGASPGGAAPSTAIQSAPQNPYLPAPGAVAVPTAQPQAQGDDVKNPLKLMNWARESLTYLSKKASANADASLYADWLVDNVPEGVDVLEFAKYLAHPDWWTYVQQFCPAVTPYHGWFTEFRDILIDVLEEKFAVQILTESDVDTQIVSDTEREPTP